MATKNTKLPAAFVVKVNFEFTEDQIASLISSAYEGGSNYWAGQKDGKGAPYRIGKTEDGSLGPLEFVPGFAVTITDLEEERNMPFTYAMLKRGLQAMAEHEPRHFADLLADNTDASTGDVFFQCCIFGEVLYG